MLALAAYSLGRLFGGAFGPDHSHGAAFFFGNPEASGRLVLLQANGTVVPPYFNPRYQCEMELLRFDSRRPNPRFAHLVELLKERLTNVRVVTAHQPTAPSFRPCHWSRCSPPDGRPMEPASLAERDHTPGRYEPAPVAVAARTRDFA